MAKVTWAPGIQTVSGALSKINKKSPHASDQKMLLATHRVAPTTSPDCSRLFLRGIESVTRSTPISSDEQAARTRFGAIGTAVAARRKNLATIATDMANFNAQKDSGYKTFYSYLWHLCADQYDQNNG